MKNLDWKFISKMAPMFLLVVVGFVMMLLNKITNNWIFGFVLGTYALVYSQEFAYETLKLYSNENLRNELEIIKIMKQQSIELKEHHDKITEIINAQGNALEDITKKSTENNGKPN